MEDMPMKLREILEAKNCSFELLRPINFEEMRLQKEKKDNMLQEQQARRA